MNASVLFRKHFQLAYVVEDVDAATAHLGDRYGISRFNKMDMVAAMGSDSATRFICTAWIGDVMIEVIEPNPGVDSIYRDWRCDGNGPLKFHHLGFLVDSHEQFAETTRQLAENGSPTVVEGRFGDLIEYAYADTRQELGHYYEIIHLLPAGRDFFDNVPHN